MAAASGTTEIEPLPIGSGAVNVRVRVTSTAQVPAARGPTGTSSAQGVTAAVHGPGMPE